jgi:hypothetical protein
VTLGPLAPPEVTDLVGTVVGVAAKAGPRMRFGHGLIREAIYESIPASLRSVLHLQAARALADAGAEPERVAAQLVAAPEITNRWVRDWLIGRRACRTGIRRWRV